MKKKMLFVVNVNAGKKIMYTRLCDVADLFTKADYEIILHISQGVNDIYTTIKEYKDVDCIVCSGGDGSLNETIRACVEMNYKNPIGYIPAGTTNDFAKTLKLSMDPIKSAKKIVDKDCISCDVGMLNDMNFVYIAAFGALTDVSYSTPQMTKNILGASAYVLEGLKQLFDLKKYEVKIESDEVILQDTFCLGMVCNTLSVGGVPLFKKEDVSLNDGYFECVFIKYPKNVNEYQQIIQSLLMDDFKDHSNILFFKTKKLKITSKTKIAWTVDGEFGGNYEEVDILNLQKAIKIYK